MVANRPVEPDGLPFLWDMGREATAADPGLRPLGREAAFARPEPRTNLEGWGRRGDTGVVAVDEPDRRLGAAWYPFFAAEARGYGCVAADVLELPAGVVADARGWGAGADLLDALLATARAQGLRAINLSVDRQNLARRLHERKGVRDAGVSGPADTTDDSFQPRRVEKRLWFPTRPSRTRGVRPLGTAAAPDGHLSTQLEDGEDVARGILEPGDRRPRAAGDALLVLLEALVPLETHAARGQLVNGRVDVVDREVEDGVGRGGVIRLGVDERAPIAGKVQR